MVIIRTIITAFLFSVAALFVLSACAADTNVEQVRPSQEETLPSLIAESPKLPETEPAEPPEITIEPEPPSTLTQTVTVIDNWTDSADNPTFEDVKYSKYDRNVLDFWKARSEVPTPVLIYFHGGGFVAGDKDKFRDNVMLEFCLQNGISVVSANYRYVTQSPFPAPFEDGARVVQFVRWKAAEWNLDPGRVAMMGGSAGAGMSLWLATHDDIADITSQDPVKCQSTRLSCALASGGQSFYDPQMILENIGGNPDVHSSLLSALSVNSIEESFTPEKQSLAYEVSAINFVTAGDPPLYLSYGGELSQTPLPEDTPVSVSIHHPKFGQMLKEKYDAFGLECIFRYKGDGLTTESQTEFLLRCLTID